jgi:hypothetical protein
MVGSWGGVVTLHIGGTPQIVLQSIAIRNALQLKKRLAELGWGEGDGGAFARVKCRFVRAHAEKL